MAIGQIISAETVNALNNINPLGVLIGFGLLVTWIAVLLIRDRNREREAQTKIALAEQANMREKLDGEREERKAFFEAIGYIRDYTGTVREMVLATVEKDVKIETRGDATVMALTSIADRLTSLGDNYTALAVSEKTIADDLHTACTLLEKIPLIEDNLKEALEILRRVDATLQMPTSNHGTTLPTNTDQSGGQNETN